MTTIDPTKDTDILRTDYKEEFEIERETDNVFRAPNTDPAPPLGDILNVENN